MVTNTRRVCPCLGTFNKMIWCPAAAAVSADRACDRLRTQNTLTKENFLMTVEYAFDKDFRWVDVQDDGAGPRWTYVARSHNPASFEGENGKSFIHQSFSIEVWIPRDGRGFIRTASDANVDDGDWTSDSQASGILRMLSLWSETEFVGLNVTEDQVIATTRSGIDRNFEAADDFLAGDVR